MEIEFKNEERSKEHGFVATPIAVDGVIMFLPQELGKTLGHAAFSEVFAKHRGFKENEDYVVFVGPPLLALKRQVALALNADKVSPQFASYYGVAKQAKLATASAILRGLGQVRCRKTAFEMVKWLEDHVIPKLRSLDKLAVSATKPFLTRKKLGPEAPAEAACEPLTEADISAIEKAFPDEYSGVVTLAEKLDGTLKALFHKLKNNPKSQLPLYTEAPVKQVCEQKEGLPVPSLVPEKVYAALKEYLNVTELSELTRVDGKKKYSPEALNIALAMRGFQTKIQDGNGRWHWVLLPAGAQYGRLDCGKNSRNKKDSILWKQSVLMALFPKIPLEPKF